MPIRTGQGSLKYQVGSGNSAAQSAASSAAGVRSNGLQYALGRKGQKYQAAMQTQRLQQVAKQNFYNREHDKGGQLSAQAQQTALQEDQQVQANAFQGAAFGQQNAIQAANFAQRNLEQGAGFAQRNLEQGAGFAQRNLEQGNQFAQRDAEAEAARIEGRRLQDDSQQATYDLEKAKFEGAQGAVGREEALKSVEVVGGLYKPKPDQIHLLAPGTRYRDPAGDISVVPQ